MPGALPALGSGRRAGTAGRDAVPGAPAPLLSGGAAVRQLGIARVVAGERADVPGQFADLSDQLADPAAGARSGPGRRLGEGLLELLRALLRSPGRSAP